MECVKETISRLPYGKVAEFIVKANELASAKVHDETLHEQITKYEDSIKAGHGVVVVAHSQGNLFTHQAYNSLDGWMQTYFHTIDLSTLFGTKNQAESLKRDCHHQSSIFNGAV